MFPENDGFSSGGLLFLGSRLQYKQEAGVLVRAKSAATE
jgi:hypothetical protein